MSGAGPVPAEDNAVCTASETSDPFSGGCKEFAFKAPAASPNPQEPAQKPDALYIPVLSCMRLFRNRLMVFGGKSAPSVPGQAGHGNGFASVFSVSACIFSV